MKGLLYLPIEKVKIKENKFDNLNPQLFSKLLSSIKKNGILEPLHVKETNNNEYILLQGHQRYNAALHLQLKELPCIIIDEDEKSLAAEYDVNLYRRHLKDGEIEKYEKLRDSLKPKYKLIPELKILEDTLSPEYLKVLASLPVSIQQNIYKAIPEKTIVDTKKITKYETFLREKEAEIEKLKSEKQKYEDKIKILEKTSKELEELRKTSKEDFEKALQIKIEETRQLLQTEYEGETLNKKINEEKEKLRKELETKHEAEMEDLRQKMVEISLAKQSLENQFTPLKDKIENLQKELDDNKKKLDAAKINLEITNKQLQQLIEFHKIPEQIKLLTSEIIHVKNKANTFIEYLIRIGNNVYEKKEKNIAALKELETEHKKLNDVITEVSKILR
ncbi:MAG: ParB N-terminal domain-containing protein [candidate division WOR-3 bacterium]